MFKLPSSKPLITSKAQEWADYAEYNAIKHGTISINSLLKPVLLIGDEVLANGILDEADNAYDKTEDIISEIQRRIVATDSKYPFNLASHGYVLEYVGSSDQLISLIYMFLLFSTRLMMSNNREHNGIDGTKTFEKLSAEIAKEYFGNKAQVDILGTGISGSFRDKLLEITNNMYEGNGVLHRNANYQPQDDKVDVVVWKGFSDRKSSQIIGFGQCKTGTSWVKGLSDLNPVAFCKRWYPLQPVVDPVKLFFCSQYFPEDIWYERATTAGIVFDRFRIMDYLPDEIEATLLEEIHNWCSGVASSLSVPF